MTRKRYVKLLMTGSDRNTAKFIAECANAKGIAYTDAPITPRNQLASILLYDNFSEIVKVLQDIAEAALSAAKDIVNACAAFNKAVADTLAEN